MTLLKGKKLTKLTFRNARVTKSFYRTCGNVVVRLFSAYFWKYLAAFQVKIKVIISVISDSEARRPPMREKRQIWLPPNECVASGIAMVLHVIKRISTYHAIHELRANL